jgi:hypothetical protein
VAVARNRSVRFETVVEFKLGVPSHGPSLERSTGAQPAPNSMSAVCLGGFHAGVHITLAAVEEQVQHHR